MICQSLTIIQLFFTLKPTHVHIGGSKTKQETSTTIIKQIRRSYFMSYKFSIIFLLLLLPPICKVSNEQSPRWHTSEIRHLLKQIKTLRKSLKKSTTQYKEVKLLLLESTFQVKCADAKIKHERSIVTSFSSKPKTLFRHLKRSF